MFIGRNESGEIYGLWTVRQWEGQEELSPVDLEVVEFYQLMEAKIKAPQPTIADIIALLPQESKDALVAKVETKATIK